MQRIGHQRRIEDFLNGDLLLELRIRVVLRMVRGSDFDFGKLLAGGAELSNCAGARHRRLDWFPYGQCDGGSRTGGRMTDLPAPAPIVNVETKPFWDATAEGKFLLPRCADCSTVIWYPRAFCPACNSFNITWFEASGKGTIYSFTVNRRGQGDYRDLPYVVAYVELEEGPRVLTNIVDVEFDALKVGMPVQVVFHKTEAGPALTRFRPA
jgi:uncharacterized OB-fold protein